MNGPSPPSLSSCGLSGALAAIFSPVVVAGEEDAVDVIVTDDRRANVTKTLHNVDHTRGNPASSNSSATIAQQVGENSDGFQIAVLPAAMTWAIAIEEMSVGSCRA